MLSDAILLVDDSPDDIFLTIHAFRQNNITNEIIVAKDGAEALELLLPTDGTAPVRPAIVLMDIKMPKIDGLAALEGIRANPQTRAIPVIMLTTSVEDCDITDSYSTGANSYIAKPVTAAEFLQVTQALGLYWLGHNRQVGPYFQAIATVT